MNLCSLVDYLHAADENITLKVPTVPTLASSKWLSECLDLESRSALARNLSSRRVELYLRRVRLWWKQANQLKCLYVSHISKYRCALSYQSTDQLDLEQQNNYAVACYADCNNTLGGHTRLPPAINRTTEYSTQTFYRAFMARTFDTKALHGLALFLESSNPGTEDHTYDKIVKLWSENPHRSLLESAEVLEIFDYASNFLLFQIFNRPTRFCDWRGSIFLDENDTFLNNWMSFVVGMQPFLTPSDILELFQRNLDVGGKIPHEQLSLYVHKFARDQPIFDFPIPTMKNIECDVSTKLKGSAAEAWETFRCHDWCSDIRGRAFMPEFDLSKIIIQNQGEESRRLWWECLRRIEYDFKESSLTEFIQVDSWMMTPLRGLKLSDYDAGKYLHKYTFALGDSATGVQTQRESRHRQQAHQGTNGFEI